MSSAEPAFVIDASVFVADARPAEPSHADAHRLLETLTARRCNLYVPAIVLPEIAAAISRGAGDPALAREAVDLYQHRPGVRVRAADEALAALAAEVAAEYRIRGCDAIYCLPAQDSRRLLATPRRVSAHRNRTLNCHR